MPGVPLGTIMALRPLDPPAFVLVRTIQTLTSAPCKSQPPALQGQRLRPFRMYSPFFLSCFAVRAIPAGWDAAPSKLAVPPGVPAGSLTVQPARYSPRGSLVAGTRHFCFRPPDANQTTGINANPLTSSIVAKPGSTAQISSQTTCRSTLDIPPPPY